MRRCAAVACLCLVAGVAQAEEMDPALSRLRIPAGQDGCPADRGYCPDPELFEKLASEIAVALTSPVVSAAATDGPRSFHVGLTTTATSLSNDEPHWIRGSEGKPQQPDDLNPSPSAALYWHRLHMRKGLPFGLEAGGSVGMAPGTSFWSFGGQLKLAIVEGFRSGYGWLPDIGVRVAWDFLVGAPQLSAAVTSFDLVASRKLLIGRGWRVAPLVGAQVSIVSVSSEVVDLTPGVSAFDTCRPIPGGGTCAGDDSDAQNLTVFDDLDQVRGRFVLGATAAYDWLRLGATVMFDLPGMAPGLDTPRRDFGSDRVASHAAVSLSVGAAY